MLAPQTIFEVNSVTLRLMLYVPENNTLSIICHNVNSTTPRLIRVNGNSYPAMLLQLAIFTIGYFYNWLCIHRQPVLFVV